ncbi:hypothetical protein HBB16_13835 [Pseudonocardia sp. MCCB 268]|nr:hypothetical protein [Pseudonocardia cytotoxica]
MAAVVVQHLLHSVFRLIFAELYEELQPSRLSDQISDTVTLTNAPAARSRPGRFRSRQPAPPPARPSSAKKPGSRKGPLPAGR